MNLDFELVNTNSFQGGLTTEGQVTGSGPVQEMLTGWTLLRGTTQMDIIALNSLPLEPWGISLISNDALPAFNKYFGIIEGKYALGAIVDETPFTLSQVGTVPEGARFLTLQVGARIGTRVQGFLNGNLVFDYFDSPNPFQADISNFAGKTAELDIKMFFQGGLIDPIGPTIGLNSIAFAVPEPTTVNLGLIPAVIVLIRFVIFRCPGRNTQGRPESARDIF